MRYILELNLEDEQEVHVKEVPQLHHKKLELELCVHTDSASHEQTILSYWSVANLDSFLQAGDTPESSDLMPESHSDIIPSRRGQCNVHGP